MSRQTYILSGQIIEKVTGNAYAAEVKKRIIDTLALKHTYMPAGLDMTGKYSHGYTYDLGGGLKDITRQQVATWGWSAGGLVSDLADLRVRAKVVATGQLLTPTMRKEFFGWIPMATKPGTPPWCFIRSSGTMNGLHAITGWPVSSRPAAR